jgi:hypothetical protein
LLMMNSGAAMMGRRAAARAWGRAMSEEVWK